ncbi:MAG: hypothetical protein LAT84_02055 [Balneolia bacterium]|nr:hypothetical protein [Balneolia bacterium]
MSKSEVIDPGGDGEGSGPSDPVDPGEPGGGTPPVGDDDDPCDEFGGGDDGDGTGCSDSDEDFAPHMAECTECDAPNPPDWCPAASRSIRIPQRSAKKSFSTIINKALLQIAPLSVYSAPFASISLRPVKSANQPADTAFRARRGGLR